MQNAARIIVVTGTDTGVGKTVLSALLTAWLHRQGERVAVFKPVCSGGRDDAERLRQAAGGWLALGDVNPWFFEEPLAPLLAARQEGREVRLTSVGERARELAARSDTLVVEGAGGLLSPLGEGFDTRDLITRLRAWAIIVAPNRLGAVNQVRLVLAALPATVVRRTQVVLVNPPKPDRASATNTGLLAEFFPKQRLHELPWLLEPADFALAVRRPNIARVLARIAARFRPA